MNRFVLFFSCLLTSCLFANPQGFNLVAGDASPPYINPQGTMIIENDGRSIINWTSFSINNGEWVHFDQTGSNAAVLNRVTGTDMSMIHGRLSSNACIYLINSNGILIGPKGYIETAGFLASTYNLLNQKFLLNDPLYFFGDSDQGVLNEGIIDCEQGNIILCGMSAASTGVASAPNGYVQIRSGQVPFLVKQEGTRNIYLKLDPRKSENEEDSEASQMISSNGETFLVAP